MISVLTHIMQKYFRFISLAVVCYILCFIPFIQETYGFDLHSKLKPASHYDSYKTDSVTLVSESCFTNNIEDWFCADNVEIDPMFSDKRNEIAIVYFVANDIALLCKNTIAPTSGSVSLLWLFAVF
jgi:hypothetical protein